MAAACTALLAPMPALARLSLLDILFVFGDSVLDGGNAGLRTTKESGGAITYPPPPYADGRFSNGPTSVEYLWNLFHPTDPFYSTSNPSAPFRPSLAGGTNYSIGGATTGVANNNGVSEQLGEVISGYFKDLGNAWERNTFIASAPAFDPATSLFVIELFPNDVLYNQSTRSTASPANPTGDLAGSFDGAIQPGPPTIQTPPPDVPTQVLQQIIANAVNNIISTVADLYQRGARNILVFNSTDLGRIPAAGPPDQEKSQNLTLLSNVFNASLEGALNSIRPSLAEADLELFDFYALTNSIYADPNAYGLDDNFNPCLTKPACVNDPQVASRRIFWDDLHPTTALYQNVGQALYSDVVAQVPAPLPLVGVGVAFRYSRRLRKRINGQRRSTVGATL
jgi:phospholipase/lecithinase/hemolysin